MSTESEVARLHREKELLEQQVKLLVQTEQRLFRSQNALDHQLAHMRALAEFSLAASASEDPDAILELGAGLVSGAFLLDVVAGVVVEGGRLVVRGARPQTRPDTEIRLSPHALTELLALERAVIRRWPAPEEPLVAELVANLVAPPGGVPSGGVPPGAGTMAILPLRSGAATLAVLVLAAADRRRASYKHDTLDERGLHFLQMVASHLSRALAAAMLTSRLRDRSEELGRANSELQASLLQFERAQQQLVEASTMEAIGRLAGGVAHDFNNLLTILLGVGSQIAERTEEEETRTGLNAMVEAAEKAARITGQLLALGRKQVLARAPVDLNEAVTSMSSVLGRLMGDNIELRLELGSSVPMVMSDRTQVEQVLLNLVVNARDALSAGGTIRVATREASERDRECHSGLPDDVALVVLEVADDGDGMDGETLSRVFEPFFTTKALGRGTGLGLAVVHGIVTQSGGRIHVDSVPGRGTTFTILLPQTEAEAATPAASAPTGSGQRVLLVEDEPTIRMFTGRVLRDAGYKVIEACDGVEGLEAFQRCSAAIDLVVCDVRMPRMDGIELVTALRREKPALPVLFVSGYSPEHADGGAPGGIDAAFLAKPFKVARLLETVREVLANARR